MTEAITKKYQLRETVNNYVLDYSGACKRFDKCEELSQVWLDLEEGSCTCYFGDCILIQAGVTIDEVAVSGRSEESIASKLETISKQTGIKFC